MLQAFVLGLVLVAALWLGAGWFTRVEPRKVLRATRWLLLAAAVGAVALLVLTGRLGWALAAIAAALPWAVRLLRLVVLGRVAHGLWQNAFGGGFGGGAAPWGVGGAGGPGAAGSAGVSAVDTAWLSMRLDLATGEMDGTVRQGPLRGRTLGGLDDGALAGLWADTGADADSRRLLEAWLDRCRPQWRTAWGAAAAGDAAGGGDDDSAPTAPPAGAMDRAEALRVLGLEDGADAEAVRAAHRRLMAAVHPDHGGSDWLAAKLNQARDILLG